MPTTRDNRETAPRAGLIALLPVHEQIFRAGSRRVAGLEADREADVVVVAVGVHPQGELGRAVTGEVAGEERRFTVQLLGDVTLVGGGRPARGHAAAQLFALPAGEAEVRTAAHHGRFVGDLAGADAQPVPPSPSSAQTLTVKLPSCG